MRMARRRVIEGGADMAREVVADLLGDTRPEDLAGYIAIGLMKQPVPGGFRISSNAADDAAEIKLLEQVLAALKRSLAGEPS